MPSATPYPHFPPTKPNACKTVSASSPTASYASLAALAELAMPATHLLHPPPAPSVAPSQIVRFASPAPSANIAKLVSQRQTGEPAASSTVVSSTAPPAPPPPPA